MTFRAIVASVASASIICIYSHAFAQTDPSPAATTQSAEKTPSEESIAKLIQDLDGNRFSKRQDASRRLKEIGQPAIKALSQTVLGGSREASSRAFEILKDHFANGDEQLKQAAKAALQKLAASDKAPVARKAKDVLEPKPVQPPQQVFPFGPNQIQVQFQIGGARQVQIRNVNGVKDIDAKEGDRSIKIHEDPNKGITVEITEKKNGKDVKKKYEAKDVAELKKKHPEAHKLYEKYSQGGGIRIQAIQAQALPAPGMGNPFRAPTRRLIDTKPITEELEKISGQVEEALKQLKQVKSSPHQPESLQKAIKELEQAQKVLKEVRDKMR